MHQNEDTPPNEQAHTNLLDHHHLSSNIEPITLQKTISKFVPCEHFTTLAHAYRRQLEQCGSHDSYLESQGLGLEKKHSTSSHANNGGGLSSSQDE